MIWRWIDERAGLGQLARALLDEREPPNVGWLHTFGSLLLFCLLLSMLTGAAMVLYYAPTPDHAHASVQYITERAPLGRLVRGLHVWSASFAVVALTLHLLRVFLSGAYKLPRELTWIVGVLLLLLIFGFLFTGHLLPWDQRAYWATVVGTEMMGAAPGLGTFVLHLVRGGEEIGPLTLTRFFALHVLFLPVLLIIGVVFHLYLMLRIGIAGPVRGEGENGRGGERESGRAGEQKDRNAEESPIPPFLHSSIQGREGTGDERGGSRREGWRPFYPYQAARDITVVFITFIAMILLAWLYPPTLENVADPSDTSYTPRPPWYFLFLFQFVRSFEGPFEVIGAVVLPTVGMLLLLLLPFLDRRPERRPFRRPVASAAALLGVAGFLALTILGATTAPPPVMEVAVSEQPEDRATSPTAPLTPTELAGKVYFQEHNCLRCHRLNGQGAKIGPDLAGVGKKRDAEWLNQHFQNPSSIVPGTIMPPLDLPIEKLNALSAYLLRLNDPASPAFQDRPVIEEGGRVLYETGCLQCHVIFDTGTKGMAPDLSQVGARREEEWIVDQIRNSRSHNPGSVMPIYGEKLTTEEIEAVAEFLSTCR
ncbi:MAG: cytochrome b N-terminal domain-containing protein [Candidatus Latescibacteria bacterium]|nr:cytochrome b N-terminal domain-containing protein [Candidatus Latescibacterota bacterium]